MPELSEVISAWSTKDPIVIDESLKRDTNVALWLVMSQMKQLINLILTQSEVLSRAATVRHEITRIEHEQDSADDKHITTKIYWNDGDITTVKNIEDDEFNALYAINLGIAVKFMGSENKLRNVYKAFAREAYEHEYEH